jgi:hypothetical protein
LDVCVWPRGRDDGRFDGWGWVWAGVSSASDFFQIIMRSLYLPSKAPLF